LTIIEPDLIAQYVCSINARQCNQAHQTLSKTGYWADLLGLDALGLSAEDILSGWFQIPDGISLLPEKAIIEALGQPVSLVDTSIQHVIDPADFQAT
jgi:hypothetical protein